MTPDVVTAILDRLESPAAFRIITPPAGRIAPAELPHLHPYWELKLPYRGAAELVPPEVVHRASDQRDLLAVIDIDGRDFSVSQQEIFLLCKVRLGPAAPVLTGLLDLCRKLPAEDTELRNTLFAEFARYFCRILRSLDGEAAQELDPYRRAVAFLDYRYHDPELSVTDLAHFMAVSPQYLNRLFRRCGQTTVRQELLKIRFARARELLRKGYSVSETAALTGWHGQFHFSRMFKRHFGVTPCLVRKEGKIDDPR